MIKITILTLMLLASTGCTFTLTLNVLNNRSSQPTAGSGEALAENATTGGADIKADTKLIP